MLNLPGVRSSSSDQEIIVTGRRVLVLSTHLGQYHHCHFTKHFSLLLFVLWGSLAHVCIFTFYQWCCYLMSSLDSMNHPGQLVSATRWQHNTIQVWKEEGAMGLRDLGYVPLTKPSPEIRHHFLWISSTDTLKIKRSITMFCLIYCYVTELNTAYCHKGIMN